ncbi:MAG: DNA-directed RNA polymerase subunit omega [Eubacteriales bacterium]|nr:DNA-directed RNA polymerase subunit omega [Eubacteriales bacterium]
MIIKPGISTLEKCVDDGCRYVLVTMAAKRARMIGESGEGLVEADSKKAVSVAVAEIAAGKIGYTKVKEEAPKTEEE